MKFQPDTLDGVNLITRHEPGRLWVGAQEHAGSVLVPWRGTVQPWGAASHAALTAEHFARIAAVADEPPDVVIFGSGAKLAFVRPALLAALIARRIGVETMDTAAACRTYNVLAAEGRRVVAALLSAAASASGADL